MMGFFVSDYGIAMQRETLKVPSERYQEPKTSQEAKEAFDKASKERLEAQRAIDEREKEYTVLNERLKKTTYGSDEWNKLDKAVTDQVERLNQAVAIEDKWRGRQEVLSNNQLVQEYVKELGSLLPEQIPLPSAFKRLFNDAKIWVKTNIQIPFNEFLGDKAKIIQIRQDLGQLYIDIGKNGLLAKARNNKELALIFDDLSGKIGSHIAALEDYREAQKSNVITDQEKKVVQQEIEAIVTDLLSLSTELSLQKVDAKVKNEIKKIVDAVLGDFALNFDAKLRIYQKTGTSISQEEILDLANQIRTDYTKMQGALKKKPIDFFIQEEYKKYISNVSSLEKIDLSGLQANDQAVISYVIRNAYQIPLREIFQELSSNQVFLAEERDILRQGLIELVSSAQEADAKFEKIFNQLLEKEATEATQEQIGVEKPLTKGVLDNIKYNLDRLSLAIEIENVFYTDAAVIREQYKTFDEAATNWVNVIDRSAVSQESLIGLENILSYYESLLSKINQLSAKSISALPEELIAIIPDLILKISAIGTKSALDRSALVIIKEGIAPGLVKQVDRPLDQQAYLAAIAKESQNWPQFASLSKEHFLQEIKKEPLVTSENNQNIEVNSQNFKKQVIESFQ